MNARLTTIARRRAALVAQVAAQRTELDRLMRPWRMPLALAQDTTTAGSMLTVPEGVGSSVITSGI